MREQMIYDIAGIGIGPFNLGMAALCHPHKKLKTIFFERKLAFDWHGGMKIPGSTLQVSYLADLVTLADPSSPFTYLNFLRNHNRLIQFGIHEKNYILRTEYIRYCQWVCSKLNNLRFGYYVQSVRYSEKEDIFCIQLLSINSNKPKTIYTRHIVVGVGSTPYVPDCIMEHLNNHIIHSSDYGYHNSNILKSKKITIVGSGQSAAEIFHDLLNTVDLPNTKLNWITRSDRFYAMETSKLNYEMTSPDYIDFFHGLDSDIKERLLKHQFSLYKGINQELIEAIYEKLYYLFTEEQRYQINICSHAEIKHIIKKAENEYELSFYHLAEKKNFKVSVDAVILATGYKYNFPHFLTPLQNHLQLDSECRYLVNRNYSVDAENRVFVQNAEMHTHGFNAPDLGLGAYRNAIIINTIMQQETYPVDQKTAFRSFGLPA